MKLLDPEMKNYQAMMQRLNRSGDFEGTKSAQRMFMALREKHGISGIGPFLSLLQVTK